MEKKRDRKREGLMSVDLLSYKKPWIAFCKAQGVSPSDALRQVVSRLVGQRSEKTPPPVGSVAQAVTGEFEKTSVRKEIALTASEYQMVERLADADGFSVNKWIVALIRARLTQRPQFGQHELEALAQSNLQLMKIGRNLNQIAKALNTAPHERGVYRIDLIEQIDAMVKAHTGSVSAMVAASTQRWRLK